MQLYSFFRSGTSHRVRIALNLKGLSAQYMVVDLRTEAHQSADYKDLNPQGLVPALVKDGKVMTQSPAIIEWLEETHPTPALLPNTPDDRARVRALAAMVACDIHPINNRRILEYLRHQMKVDEAAINAWCVHWITQGFDAYEALLRANAQRGRFSFGDAPGLADLYLVPQVESARRFKVDMARWPLITAVDAACMALDAFQKAAPAVQPDAS
jgi:maleylpyruvate isomerase